VANKRAADAEEKCATKDAEITKMRLECLGREKAAARRAREESELALLAERRASEEAIQRLGAEEEERVRKRVAAAKREWEKKMSEVRCCSTPYSRNMPRDTSSRNLPRDTKGRPSSKARRPAELISISPKP
jgi:hypothetical protein